MEQGYLALVLHAHLPYVRHPEYQDALEENWLFEAITESYIPLALVCEDLIRDGIDFRLTFSITPTLATMLEDPLLQSRYRRRLERLLELAAKEIERTRSDAALQPLARMYLALFKRVHDAFVNRYRLNVLNAFRRFQDLGYVEIMASAATHGYLPLLAANESAVRAQIGVGVESYRQTFGCNPRGFWLPECGYAPGIDEVLDEHGIGFTIVETHGLTRADERPRYGVYAPVYCPSGVAAFGRDPESSRQVWSANEGYPGDFDYREFYRDVGHDLEIDYIGPYIHKDGIRIDTGIKYHRITGKDGNKETYVPEWAERKAESHAGHFLSERSKQVERLRGLMDRKPLVVAPFDAELFGHWWFEGPRWLDYLIRKTALEQDAIRLATLSEYLEENPLNQTATPSMSSWGVNGFNEMWLNGKNDWIYPHLHSAAAILEDLSASHRAASGLTLRALNQMARELLLAQASDWAFMISSGNTRDYATASVRRRLDRFHSLRHGIEQSDIDQEWLSQLEYEDHIFPEIAAFSHFRADQFQRRTLISAEEPTARVRAVRAPGRPLHVVMICPEIMPFAKTGGLADMTGSLAAALQKLGHRVSLIMPAYETVLRQKVPIEDTGVRLTVTIGGRTEEAQVLASRGSGVEVYFIRTDRYFGRSHLYGTREGDYPDNAERFAFFCRAALESLRGIGLPDVLHAHDWQAALAIVFLKAQPERYPGLAAVRTVFTVHNLGYQGLFPEHHWHFLGLDRSYFSTSGLEFFGKVNLLKGGLVFADRITTVSPTYSREIRTADYGFGLDGVLRQREGDLAGILNGADYDVWNPATDPFLVENYTTASISGKWACKAAAQRLFGLPEDSRLPLFAMVSRLAGQKGLDLVEAILPELLARELQCIFLGSGDRRYEDSLQSLAKRYPERIGVRIAFEESLAHQIEAGADMFLMPSRYEPGGLNQLYSMRYGTIPIVRATGGLKDSVQEFDPVRGQGTGFLFEAYDSAALLGAIDRALTTFQRKTDWNTLMKNAMTADFSWDLSARQYVQLYESLLTGRQRDD
jgi:1,4-alpha-glucan branching enzyme